MNINYLVKLDNEVAEGPFWDAPSQSLYWVDMVQDKFFCFDTASKELMTWAAPQNVAAVFTTADPDYLLVLLADGLTRFHKTKQTFDYICKPDIASGSVFNDAKQDAYGRLWALTKASNHKDKIAGLYYFDKDYKYHQLDDGFILGNGVGFSPDNCRFYTTDSIAQVMYSYSLALENVQLGPREVFREVPKSDGLPDGLCVDASGNIWSALFGAWQLICYAPDGSIKQRVKLPVQNPTSCCFGGKDMQTLFITTGTHKLSDEQLKQQPLAGSIFAVSAS